MSLIVILFLIGVALLAADVFATSVVLAVCGGLSMGWGCVVAYRHYGAAGAGIAALLAFGLLALTVYLELAVLPRTRLGRGLVVESTAGQPLPLPPEALVGKPAEALTTLAPSGYVSIEGRRYEAFCRSGHAARGSALKVVGIDNFRVIVSKPEIG